MLSYSKDDITRILGEEARDVNGKSVGFVDLVFIDDETGRPEWMGVWNGLPGSHRHLVPLRGVEEQGSELRVPWTKDLVKSAPTYDEEDDRGLIRDDPDGIHISHEKERAAYEHYGLEPESPVQEGVIRLRTVVVTVGRVD